MKKEDIQTYKVLENYDELIIDKNFRHHLFRNCIELTKDVEALFAMSYANNWWKYRDAAGFEHLFDENNNELTKDIKTMVVECHNNRYWKYMSKNGSWNIIDNNGKNITENIPYIYECIVYNDGSFDYRSSENDEFKGILNRDK